MASQDRSHRPVAQFCWNDVAATAVPSQPPELHCCVQLAPLQLRLHPPVLQTRSQVEPAAQFAAQESVSEHVKWQVWPARQLHVCKAVHVSFPLVPPPLWINVPETVHVLPPCGVHVPANVEPETVTLQAPGTPSAVLPE